MRPGSGWVGLETRMKGAEMDTGRQKRTQVRQKSAGLGQTGDRQADGHQGSLQGSHVTCVRAHA